jgi:hypothetical protein
MPTSVVAEPLPTLTPIVHSVNETVVQPVAQVAAPIVTPAIAEVDTWMKMNPYFDWSPFLGIPFWILIAAFFLLVLILVNAYWFFRIKKLRSVKGYVDAVKMATQEDVMTWIVSTTKNLTIECLKKRDSVLSFYDPINITKWMHNSPMSVIHIGGKGGVIVSEDYYKTRDMVSEIALCYAAEEFNSNQDKLLAEYGEKVIAPITDYTDYEAYGRKILEHLNPDGLKIPSYSIYDPNKFRKYFPKGYTATFNGGIFIRAARNLNLGNNKLSFWEKVIPLGLIVGFVIISIVAAWMVPL